ncbi:MAG: RDD family protein [bacterium]|nr:RDD family protein [bacterium]
MWTLAGAVADEPTTIKALTNPADSPIDLQILDAVPFILLTAAMIFVIARRRQNIAEEVILPDGLAPAAHGRRVTGFLLDAVITAPATYAIMAAWFRHIGPDSDLEGNVGTALALHSWELYWRWLTALAVYIAYHILFEGLRGATPGKMIVGCRVVNEHGQRCSLGAIVVRNVLRVVEFFPRFAVAPILVLVILTRNRQRLGDLAARTVVVERRDPNGTTANPPRSSDPGNP